MVDEKKKPEGEKLVIYDVPLTLIKQWISLSKLFFDNKMCLALDEGMGLLLMKYGDKKSELAELRKRIDDLEVAINMIMKRTSSKNNDEPEELKTFGGGIKDEKIET